MKSKLLAAAVFTAGMTVLASVSPADAANGYGLGNWRSGGISNSAMGSCGGNQGYNRSAYNNNNNGYFGDRAFSGMNSAKAQRKIQKLIDSGRLPPAAQARLQERLAYLQTQQPVGGNLAFLPGQQTIGGPLAFLQGQQPVNGNYNDLIDRQNYLQKLLNSGNLSPWQAQAAQGELAQLQNAQGGLGSGTLNASALAGLRRYFGF